MTVWSNVGKSNRLPKYNNSNKSNWELLRKGISGLPEALKATIVNIPKGLVDLPGAIDNAIAKDISTGGSQAELGLTKRLLWDPFANAGTHIGRTFSSGGYRQNLEEFAQDPSMPLNDLITALSLTGARAATLGNAGKLGKFGKVVEAADRTLVKNPILKVTKPIREPLNEYRAVHRKVSKAEEILAQGRKQFGGAQKGVFSADWVKAIKKLPENEFSDLIPHLQGKLSVLNPSEGFQNIAGRYSKLSELEQQRLIGELSHTPVDYMRGALPKENIGSGKLAAQADKGAKITRPSTKASNLKQSEETLAALQRQMESLPDVEGSRLKYNELLQQIDEVDRPVVEDLLRRTYEGEPTILNPNKYTKKEPLAPEYEPVVKQLLEHYSNIKNTEVLPQKLQQGTQGLRSRKAKLLKYVMNREKFGPLAETMGVAPQSLAKTGMSVSKVGKFSVQRGGISKALRSARRITLPKLRQAIGELDDLETNPSKVLPATVLGGIGNRIGRGIAAKLDKTLGKTLPEGVSTTLLKVKHNATPLEGFIDPNTGRQYVKYPKQLQIKELTGTQGMTKSYLPKEVVEHLMRPATKVTSPAGKAALKWGIDVPTRVWRSFTLGMSPRWVVNNVIGNAFMNTLAGVGPKSHLKAIPYVLDNTKLMKKLPGLKQIAAIHPKVGKKFKGIGEFKNSTLAEAASKAAALKEYTETVSRLPQDQLQGLEQIIRDAVAGKSNITTLRPEVARLVELRKKAGVENLLPKDLEQVQKYVEEGVKEQVKTFQLKKFKPRTKEEVPGTYTPDSGIIDELTHALYTVLTEHPEIRGYKDLANAVNKQLKQGKVFLIGEKYPRNAKYSFGEIREALFPKRSRPMYGNIHKMGRKGENAGEELGWRTIKQDLPIRKEFANDILDLYHPKYGSSADALRYMREALSRHQRAVSGDNPLGFRVPSSNPFYEIMRVLHENPDIVVPVVPKSKSLHLQLAHAGAAFKKLLPDKQSVMKVLEKIAESHKTVGKRMPLTWKESMSRWLTIMMHNQEYIPGQGLTEKGIKILEQYEKDLEPEMKRATIPEEARQKLAILTQPQGYQGPEIITHHYTEKVPYRKEHTVKSFRNMSPEELQSINDILQGNVAAAEKLPKEWKWNKQPGRGTLKPRELERVRQGAPYAHQVRADRMSFNRFGKAALDVATYPLTRTNELAEDLSRVAHYISKRDKGLGQGASLKSVNKWLFDYSKMSQGEKGIMKRIFPFWAWQRNIGKLSMQMPFTDPLKTAALTNIGRYGVGDIPKEMEQPEWRQGLIPLPQKDEGGRTMFLRSLGFLPFADIGNYTSPMDILGSLNPTFKVPLEQTFKYNMLAKRPFSNPYPVVEGGKSTNYAPGLIDNYLNNFPQYQLAKNLMQPYSKYDTGEPMLNKQGYPYFHKNPALEWLRLGSGLSLMPRDVEQEQASMTKVKKTVNTIQNNYYKRLNKWNMKGNPIMKPSLRGTGQ